MNKAASVAASRHRLSRSLSIVRASSRRYCARMRRPSEANRRVEEETIQAMRKAGLMRVCTPKRYGGWEMNTRAMLDVSSAIAEGRWRRRLGR